MDSGNNATALNLRMNGKVAQIKFYPDSDTLYATFYDGTTWRDAVLLANFNK